MQKEPIIVEARISSSWDSLILVPRNRDDALHTLDVIRNRFGNIRFRRSAYGISVDAFDAHELFTNSTAFDIKANSTIRRYVENRRQIKDVRKASKVGVQKILSAGTGECLKILANESDLHLLDDHQIRNVAAMTLPGSHGLCLFDEQGAGKTVTMIFAFDVLVNRDEVDFALIVAPKSMISEWPKDFGAFKGDLYRIAIASGTRKEKMTAISARADVLVTNFETAMSMEDEIQAVLRNHNGRAMLVVDESFYVKNLGAQRTQAIRRLREWCKRAYVLCGTPSPNSPNDIIEQFNIVDFGFTFHGVSIPEDTKGSHDKIQTTIQERGIYIRNLKQDVLPNLPGRRYQKVLLPLQPVQEALYRKALNDLVTDVKLTNGKTFQKQLAGFLARRNALLQICSNPTAINVDYTETPSKLIALDSILEDLIDQKKEKTIIWSFFTHSIDCLFKRYQRYRPVRYDGQISDVKTRRLAIQRFQEDDSTMLFVGNPAAAGAGLTLHRSRTAIYESFSNQAAHYLQSLDRIHRRGQSRTVEYIILLCDRTLEAQEYSRLLDKQASAQSLLGDPDEVAVTREVFLAELTEAAKSLN